MPATTTREEPTPDATGLAEEVHRLERDEAALERRTRSLELSGPLAVVLALIAMAFAIAAFVVALTKNDNDTVGGMMRGVAAPAAATGGTSGAGMMGSSGGMMAGYGGHGRFSSAQVAAAAHGTVDVQLGDFWVAPAAGSVKAGRVTFVAKNVGRLPHELMVERMPIKMDAPMAPNEAAAQGMIADMDPGHSGRMTLSLKPGSYMLFCNIQGHFAAGQHTMFTVKA